MKGAAEVKRTILITGCSSGIGLASAIRLRRRGWRVLATVRKPEDAIRLADEHDLEPFMLELSDGASIAECADRALELSEGRIEALFNNAAFGQVGAVEDVTVDNLRRQFEVNLFGAHDLTCRILPAMRKQRRGRIVQCSSVLGLVSGPYRGAYSATKFAMEALSDAMRLELADSGVKVSLIEPGPIASSFLTTALQTFDQTIDVENSPHRQTYKVRRARMEAGGNDRFKLPAEEVAKKLQHAVESPNPKTRYFVTTPTYVADGLRRVLPTRLLDRIVTSM
ncbi:MAG: SDR family NAD(P)-dependent oxidoreductase [Pseudomonadota bacterium]